MLDKLKKGHKRTQSQNLLYLEPKGKLKVKVGGESGQHRIISLIKASNQRKKQKTVCVEALQIPKQKSQYSGLFSFGKKEYQESTLANSPFSEHLLPIPERKPISHCSLQKGILKHSPQSIAKKSSQPKANRKMQHQKKKSVYHLLFSKKNNSNTLMIKSSKSQNDKSKDLWKKKVRDHTKKKSKQIF